MILRFGKHKDKELNKVPIEYLQWLVDEGINLDDPKYAVSNKRLRDACLDEINTREEKTSAQPRKGPKIDLEQEVARHRAKSPGKEPLIRSIQALIDSLYKHAAEMQKYLTEYQEDGQTITTKSDHLSC